MTDFSCPFCNDPIACPVDVHGDVQCSTCHTNVDPCCGGALCLISPPADPAGGESGET
ncbi:MAG: hypothetical protein GDA49_04325 [Rhodospirillales bacterium]|nr:hypothetical protein [Rhodospirillales bacterium]